MRRISGTGLKVSLPSVCSSSTRRALCLLHVELDSGIGAGIGAEESCKTSSCRIAVLEVSVKTVMSLLECISEMNNLEK